MIAVARLPAGDTPMRLPVSMAKQLIASVPTLRRQLGADHFEFGASMRCALRGHHRLQLLCVLSHAAMGVLWCCIIVPCLLHLMEQE